MTEIRFGEVGFIEQGDDQGKYVLVQDDNARSGGVYVFYSPNPEFLGGIEGHVFDYWLENLEMFGKFVQASTWVIRWLGKKIVMDTRYNWPVEYVQRHKE